MPSVLPYVPPTLSEARAFQALRAGCHLAYEPRWQMWYRRAEFHYDRGFRWRIPWDIARVIIALDIGEVKEGRDWGGFRRLADRATLAEQLALLALFSLETAHLLHHEILVLGQIRYPQDVGHWGWAGYSSRNYWHDLCFRERWFSLVSAWEIGVMGFAITSEGSNMHLLRIDDHGAHEHEEAVTRQ